MLTWRQRKILRTIRASVRERGYPPSMREIGDAVGLTTTSSVSYQLSTLQRKGYLHRDVGRPRTMEVRLPGRPPVRPQARSAGSTRAEAEPADDIPSQEAAYVPLIGQIAANGPILADRWVQDVFPLPRQVVGEGTLFLLNPRKSFLSEYSSRLGHRQTTRLLSAWHESIHPTDLLPGESFNLDFHSVPYYGEHPLVERHYVSARSRRCPHPQVSHSAGL